jgi:hypothetical protein
MDTDADRLELIVALGGVRVLAPTGDFMAVFDHQYLSDGVGLEVETRTPALTCRSADVERLRLRKGTAVTVADDVYKVRRHEPDGTGISTLVLEVS